MPKIYHVSCYKFELWAHQCTKIYVNGDAIIGKLRGYDNSIMIILVI